MRAVHGGPVAQPNRESAVGAIDSRDVDARAHLNPLLLGQLLQLPGVGREGEIRGIDRQPAHARHERDACRRQQLHFGIDAAEAGGQRGAALEHSVRDPVSLQADGGGQSCGTRAEDRDVAPHTPSYGRRASTP